MPGVEIQSSQITKASIRNQLKVLAQGGLSAFGDGFAFSTIIVVTYVSLLSDNVLALGLVPVFAFGAWNLGYLLAGIVLRAGVRPKWLAILTSIGRAVAIAVVAWIAYQESTAPSDRLRQFLAAYAAFALLSGMTTTSANATMRETLAITERAGLFLRRGLIGGVLVAIAGLVVYQLFSTGEVTTERAFAYCFIAAAATAASSSFFLLMIGKNRARRFAANSSGRGRSAWKESSFQRFVVVRVLLAAAGLADILLVVYAIDEIGLPLSFLGLLIIATGITFAVASILWREVAKRSGGRGTLQISAMLKLAPPLLALTTIYIVQSDFYAERRTDTIVPKSLLIAAMIAWALAATSINAGSFRYLADSRLSINTNATSWTNIVVGLSSAFALLGVWILEEWDYETAFAVAVACSLAATLASGLLANPRSRPRPRPTSNAGFGVGYSRTTLLGR